MRRAEAKLLRRNESGRRIEIAHDEEGKPMTRDSGRLPIPSGLIEWAPAIGLTGIPTFMVVLAIAAIPGHIGGKGSSRASDAGSEREASMNGDVAPTPSEEAPRASSRRVATNAASPSRPRSRGFSPVRESEPVAEVVPTPSSPPPQPDSHPGAFDRPPTQEAPQPEDARGSAAASSRAAAGGLRSTELMPTPDAAPDAPAEAPAQPASE